MTSIQAEVQQAVAVADLIGLIPADLLAGGITSNQLAGNISATKLAGGILAAQIQDGGIAGQVLESTGLVPVWVTPNDIVTGLPNPDPGGANDGQIVTVSSGAAGAFTYSSFPAIAATKLTGIAIPTTTSPATVAHGLSGIPQSVRVVLVQTSTLKEFNIEGVSATSTTLSFTISVDATYITIEAHGIGTFTGYNSITIYAVYFA